MQPLFDILAQHLALYEEYKRQAMAHAHIPHAYWTLCEKGYEADAAAYYAKAHECGQILGRGSTNILMHKTMTT
jgi:hypothetical protein